MSNMNIQHNMSAMSANRYLGVVSSAQSKSTEKLSSGYKINRAADDAAGLSISEKMRKQIRGLTQASSNAQDGISTVQTAEGALSEVTDMLQRMNELSVQAANGSNSESDRSNIQDEIDALTTEIDRVSETTKFNETYLLKGDVNAVKATDYQYSTEQAIVSNTDLYTVGTDGKITTVKAGTTLATDTTYYAGTTSKIIGEAIKATDLTAGVYSVGEQLKLKDVKVGDLISDTDLKGATYSKTAPVISATNLYQTDANGKYVAVTNGSVKNTSDYFTLTGITDASGEIKYTATKVAAPTTATGYVVADDKTIYDADGNAVVSGSTIDITKKYYGTVSSIAVDSKYASATTLVDISSTTYYTKTGSGTNAKYTAITSGSDSIKYDSSATYYTLNLASGKSDDFVAVAASDVATNTGYTAVTNNMLDADGKAVTTGAVIDMTAKYFATEAGGTGTTGKYTTLVNAISSTDYYTKTTDGKYVSVASGATYDSGTTYYTMNTGAAPDDLYSAVASTAVATTKMYQVMSGVTLYDSTGAAVTAGSTIDTSKAYYSTYSTSTMATNKVADLSTMSAASFQFQDKDGNDVAANGLYQYFDKDGNYDSSYNSGLYTKDSSGNLVAASTDEISSMIDKSQKFEKGSLGLSFQVGADATTQNKISFTLDAMDSKTLGVDGLKVTGTDDTNARNSIETIKAALSKVSSQRSGLGAIQNRLEHTISNLDNIVENTTSAESKIRDTDMAKEMVNYSKNSILIQAGQSMLAQANQSNQGVLSLLQ